jgi:hypothetical protein
LAQRGMSPRLVTGIALGLLGRDACGVANEPAAL